MGDRFFRNELPEFVPEEAGGEEAVSEAKDSLAKLLSLPYSSFSEKLQRYALELKDTVTQNFQFEYCLKVFLEDAEHTYKPSNWEKRDLGLSGLIMFEFYRNLLDPRDRFQLC